MRSLRSIAFNLYFYLNISIWMILSLPLLALPKGVLWRVIFAWSRGNIVALKWLAAIEVELRGLENLPNTPVIIAAKHQSAFETICLLHLFQRPAFILKKELMRIPLLGWYAAKLAMIPVDRKAGQKALRSMMASARSVLDDGRHIIIFPEGTRRVPGAKPAYKHGIIHLYRDLQIPVVPVALNSGLYWPRKGFGRHSGKIIVEFYPAIEIGLDGGTFFHRLQETIEQGSDRLLVEGARDVAKPPLSTETADRVTKITHT
jgi:1-acyl-sn-glycerol-3-phosphate acyltransferase